VKKMLHNFAGRIASLFVIYGEASEEDIDIYTYACEAVLSALLNVVFSLVIIFALGHVAQRLSFVIVFVILRRYTGGHHAKTHFRCILTFCVLLTFAMLLVSMLNQAFIIVIIATIALVGIIVLSSTSRDKWKSRLVSLASLARNAVSNEDPLTSWFFVYQAKEPKDFAKRLERIKKSKGSK